MPTEPSDHAARATDERDLAILAALDRREPRSAICARFGVGRNSPTTLRQRVNADLARSEGRA